MAELIDSQVLVPDLAVPVTGDEPLDVLIEELGRRAPAAAAAARLAEARRALRDIDAAGPGVAPARYRAVARALEELPATVELPRLFQVDLVRPAIATLGQGLLNEIETAAESLGRLARPRDDEVLRRFREAFTARYGGREVPLTEAPFGSTSKPT